MTEPIEKLADRADEAFDNGELSSIYDEIVEAAAELGIDVTVETLTQDREAA